MTTFTNPLLVTVSSGIAVSARSTSTTAHQHVGDFNLAADGGENAALNVASINTSFSACEVTGQETAHGTLKISHVNPGTDATGDENAAAISIDLQAAMDGGPTAAQGIFLKSTTGGTSGKVINYVDSNGATIFALLPDGSLLLTPLPA